MPVDGWVVALLLAYAAVVLLYQGAAIYLAGLMPRLDPGPGDLPDAPLVSVIIAARNEEADIGDCLDTLLAQRYPRLEILVVDGGSTDRTREIVQSKGDRVRLLPEPPLPRGWVGKNWACDLGARTALGEYLLFTDADVRYHPDAIATTVAWAEREHADLATLAPRVETSGFWEGVVMPFYVQVVLTYFRAPRMNLPSSRAALANGQYWLTRRDAYTRAGGHAAVRHLVLEDVQIARNYRDLGLRLRIAWAPELLTTRMYRNRHEMFEGLLKNIHGTRFSAARQVGFLAALIGLFWLPLAILPVGILAGSLLLSAVGAFLWFALFAKHIAFAKGIRNRATYGLLFPLAVGFYIAVVATSLVRGVAGRPLVWKGREYPLKSGTTK